MKVTFGMAEVLVICGVYLYQHSFPMSLTLLGLGLFGKAMAMGLEKAAADQRQETIEKSVKTVVDSIVGAVTGAVDLKASGTKNGTFH